MAQVMRGLGGLMWGKTVYIPNTKHLFATFHSNAVVHEELIAQRPEIRHFGKSLWDIQNGTCLQ